MSLIGDKAIVYGGSNGADCFADVFILDLSKPRIRISRVRTD